MWHMSRRQQAIKEVYRSFKRNMSANEGQKNGEPAVSLVVESTKAKFNVEASLEASVESFKPVVEHKFKIPPGKQCLLYDGRILEDDQTLKSYGLKAEDTVHLLVLGGPIKYPDADPETMFDGILGGLPSFHKLQMLYDSDPLFREMLKNPDLFRRFCSPTPMNEPELMTVLFSLEAQLARTQARGS